MTTDDEQHHSRTLTEGGMGMADRSGSEHHSRGRSLPLPNEHSEGLEVPPLDPGDSSVDCEGSASAPPEAAPPHPRVCPGCAVTFTPENDQRLHCGPACKQRAKRARARAAQPPVRPRPPTPCVDCGVLLRQKPVGPGLMRCAGCRALRAHDRAQQRRRAENAALLDVDAQEPVATGASAPVGWRRLLARWFEVNIDPRDIAGLSDFELQRIVLGVLATIEGVDAPGRATGQADFWRRFVVALTRAKQERHRAFLLIQFDLENDGAGALVGPDDDVVADALEALRRTTRGENPEGV